MAKSKTRSSAKKARSKAASIKSKKTAPKSAGRAKARKSPAQWSARVMQTSDAMDLKEGIFKQKSGLAVARSLKQSAERSTRRQSPPFRSAMSMLNFEINRGGKNISEKQRRILDQAKIQLRKLFGRKPQPEKGS